MKLHPFFLVFFLGFLGICQAKKKEFVVVVNSYNNAQWYQKNLDSIFQQDYEEFRVIYTDDCSTDGTAGLVEEYIAAHNLANKITLIKNQSRMLKMANMYYAIHIVKDHEIVVELDGDDWFADEYVLQKLNKVYRDDHIWLTYGTFKEFPSGHIGSLWCKEFPPRIIKRNEFRKNGWHTGALRTYYAWLFKLIDIEDLKYNGEFVRTACDVAYIYPMLEMASERIKLITDVLYIYNRATDISESKINSQEIPRVASYLCNKPPYHRLAEKPKKLKLATKHSIL
jgi:glycosyltransferase involved in cell wall biosynthesis